MTIEKKEQQNTVMIDFLLDDVSLMRNSEDLDHFISLESIVLHGDGSMDLPEDQSEKLPDNIHEIPYKGNIQGFQNENEINIQTENAQYCITLK
ncbi:hypothetical protein [Paenibacillus agricola]|uniref:Uncharacterized protein n=1 Tax=Paenibacillus agricola TaxID=2716264 RepID=A0ABX0J915_9BACL|nr:hypothetical protein [Paenibacillus agricola]NHN32870.1 hypothetical protein [Paenibacillus agricola]